MHQPKPIKPCKKQLDKQIKALVKKRQQHQQRIKALLNLKYDHPDATKSSVQAQNQFAEMLRKLQNQQPLIAQESLGNMGNNVNILATVTLKTQCFLQQKMTIREEGELYRSLVQHYGQNQYKIHFSAKTPKDAPLWMRELVEYLIESEFSEGLFVSIETSNQLDFYGTRFDKGRYQEIHLSKFQLETIEEQYIFKQKIQGKEIINISWLLLSRLFNAKNINFPKCMHQLFSFPIKSFSLKKSLELISLGEYTELLQKHQNQQEKSIKLYGIGQKSLKSYEITNFSKKMPLQNYKQIIHQFNELIILDQTELPVKSISLCCLKNHFVVVTLIVKSSGNYFLNFGSGITNMQYRVYLLDYQGNLIQSQMAKNGQFICTFLNEQQYEIYINPYGAIQQTESIEQSFELVHQNQQNFNFWVQGKHVYSKQGDLFIQMRLKQQYNRYTSKIAKNYLKTKIGQIVDQELKQYDTIIKRYILSIGLVVDEFISKYSKLTVTYSKKVICDEHFQQAAINIKGKEEVVLYEDCQVQSITGANVVKLNYNIIRYYI